MVSEPATSAIATLPAGKHSIITLHYIDSSATIMTRVRRFFLFSWRSPVQVTRKKWKWISCFIISAFRRSDRRFGESENFFVFFAFVRGARSQEKKFFISRSNSIGQVSFALISILFRLRNPRFKIFRDISIRAPRRRKKYTKSTALESMSGCRDKSRQKLMITISFRAPTRRESSRPGSTTKGSIKY